MESVLSPKMTVEPQIESTELAAAARALPRLLSTREVDREIRRASRKRFKRGYRKWRYELRWG